jgi:hypothetical protein
MRVFRKIFHHEREEATGVRENCIKRICVVLPSPYDMNDNLMIFVYVS